MEHNETVNDRFIPNTKSAIFAVKYRSVLVRKNMHAPQNAAMTLTHKLWVARHKLSPARRKLWPALHKLWPNVRQRLSDKSGGPAPRCDGHIRLITQHTSSRLAALCASRARSAGTACWLMSHHAVTGAFKPVSHSVLVDVTSRRYWGLQACLTPRVC